MARQNYAQIRDALIANESFEGNSMHGENRDGLYIVWSYETIIYKEQDGECIFWDPSFFSRTTSKHQGLIRSIKQRKIVAAMTKSGK